MPIQKILFNEGHGIYEMVTGAVSFEELIRSDEDVYLSGQSTTPPWFFLSDYTGIDFTGIKPNDIKKHAHAVKQMSSAGEVVIALVAPDDLVYGFSRMWQVFTEDSHIDMMSFKTRCEAEEWLIAHVKERFSIDIVLPDIS